MTISHGFLITMDGSRRIVPDGAIAIVDDRIVAIGKSQDILRNHRSGEIIDASGMAVLPGFVCTHTHLLQMLLRSMADDLKLFDWMKTIVPASAYLEGNDCYNAALQGCLELIKSGCTCVLDNHYSYAKAEFAEDCLRAFLDIGIRGTEASGMMDIDRYGFLDALPESARKCMIEETSQSVNRVTSLVKRWNGRQGLVNVLMGPGSPLWCTDELLERVHEVVQELDVGATFHLHETEDEVKSWRKEFGHSPFEYYVDKVPFIDDRVVAIHAVWMTNDEIQMLKQKGTKVSHNPVSNMYLASGIAPIPEFIRAGVVVGLGVDGAASNNNQDMFELLKTTVLLHKVARRDPTALTAHQVLEMATIGGAKAIRQDNDIGSLEVGKKADIILVDLKMCNLMPLNNVCSQLVYCGRAENVKTSIINGRIVMEDRKLLTLDESSIGEQVQKSAEHLSERAGLQSRVARP